LARFNFDPHWLANLQRRASQAPSRPRVPLLASGEVIGTVLSKVCEQIVNRPSKNNNSLLLKQEHTTGGGWEINGPITATLNRIAQALRDGQAGPDAQRFVTHFWRNEQLGVVSADGTLLGSVERGAVRPLGIATRAVHLVGRTPGGGMWVQQRALNKANDPGLWDTLMGGMISVNDSLQAALARETQEEAGLDLAQLRGVTQRGRVSISRPTDDDMTGASQSAGTTPGIGYMVEVIDWFEGVVPDGVVPVNQDGEVAQFQLLDVPELVARLQENEFTLEASLVLVAALQEAREGEGAP
jgi:8-oxo-dGTP pyrophosphatase MutT (NUDIX family)